MTINCAEVKQETAKYSELLELICAPSLEKLGPITVEQLADLIKTTENINAQDISGRSALHWAVENNRTDLVEELLKCKDININLEDNDGYTAIAIAVSSGNMKIVRVLLKQPNICVNTRIFKNKKQILEKIKDALKLDLAQRKELRQAVECGITPLMLATGAREIDKFNIIKLLLAAGATPNAIVLIKDVDKGYCERKAGDIIQYPLELIRESQISWQNGGENLIKLIKKDKFNLAKIILNNVQADVNVSLRRRLTINNYNDSPLMSVLNVRTITNMIGSDLEFEETPLLWAIIKSKVDLVRELIEHGASFNKLVQLHRKQSYLSLAVQLGNLETVSLFLNFGADPNIIDALDTPIFSAINIPDSKARLEAIEMLINAKADLNIHNVCTGTTLLDFAVGQSILGNYSFDTIALLLKNNSININETNALDSAFKLAVSCPKESETSCAEIIDMLIKAGAKTNNNNRDSLQSIGWNLTKLLLEKSNSDKDDHVDEKE